MIADEPPADVAPVVHGRWIQINGIAPPEHHGKHKCSECGGMALEKHMREVLSNYCPNCGAKMDLEERESVLSYQFRYLS